MHCPRCGTIQKSDEIRFCSKCGLDISGVKDLLSPESAETKLKRKKKRQKATKQGFLMIIAGLSLVMILGALREYFTIPKIVIILPLLIFMLGGMIRMVLASISDGSSSDEEDIESFINNLETGKLSGNEVSDKTLPEAKFQTPIDFGVKDFDTNEFASPPSVTENTTRKLEKELREK